MVFHYIQYFNYPIVEIIKVQYRWKRVDKTVEFGAKLKHLRKGQNLTQQQLADRLGVAKSVVSYYESGDRFPSYDVLIRIARLFRVSTDYLLDVEREKTINVSDLSDENIAVVVTVANALRKNRDS